VKAKREKAFVLRGGGWDCRAEARSRSAYRSWYASERHEYFGFRPVLDVPKEKK